MLGSHFLWICQNESSHIHRFIINFATISHIYSGPRDSAIGQWILTYRLGWIIDPGNIPKTAQCIAELLEDDSKLAELQRHCHAIYQRHFSRRIVMEAWNRELRALLRD